MLPKPESILKLCEYFKVSPTYFHEYYKVYFDNPGGKIRTWKDKNNYTYNQAMEMLNISYSEFGRLMNGRLSLSYEMYLKLKKFMMF